MKKETLFDGVEFDPPSLKSTPKIPINNIA